MIDGRTAGLDGTTLEANAAMRSIVRRHTGEGYAESLAGLARASGIETPTREVRARLDRKRPKKASNQDWVHPQDPDAENMERVALGFRNRHRIEFSTRKPGTRPNSPLSFVTSVAPRLRACADPLMGRRTWSTSNDT